MVTQIEWGISPVHTVSILL